MSNYIQLGRVYFNDKDISDILRSGVFTEKQILQYARSRGVIFGPEEDKNKLIDYVSRLGFDWVQLKIIADKLNSADRIERVRPYRLPSTIAFSRVEEAFNDLKTKRGQEEVYILRKTGDTTCDIDVTYTEVDTSKGRAFQRQKKEFTIEVEEVGGNLRIKAARGERPHKIVNQFISFLRGSENEKAEVEEVSLRTITDAKKRSRFFFLLMDKLKGFSTENVKDLKLESRFPADKDDEVDENVEDGPPEEAEVEAQEEVKGLVRRAVLSGQALIASELYQKLDETGFYISGMVWRAKETSGLGREVEFEVTFDDPVEGTGLSFGARKIYTKSEAGGTSKTAHTVPSVLESKQLNKSIEEASFNALAALKEEIAKESAS